MFVELVLVGEAEMLMVVAVLAAVVGLLLLLDLMKDPVVMTVVPPWFYFGLFIDFGYLVILLVLRLNGF